MFPIGVDSWNKCISRQYSLGWFCSLIDTLTTRLNWCTGLSFFGTRAFNRTWNDCKIYINLYKIKTWKDVYENLLKKGSLSTAHLQCKNTFYVSLFCCTNKKADILSKPNKGCNLLCNSVVLISLFEQLTWLICTLSSSTQFGITKRFITCNVLSEMYHKEYCELVYLSFLETTCYRHRLIQCWPFVKITPNKCFIPM